MKRIGWIDNIKGIAIILVVMGHVCQMRFPESGKSLADFIYSFHMPLFLFLSGLFATKAITAVDQKEGLLFVKKKVNGLLVPFAVWTIFCCILKHKDFYLFLNGGYIYWYLLSLFEFLMLFCIIRYLANLIKFKSDILFHILIFVSAIVLYLIPEKTLVGYLFRLNYTPGFYVSFVFGYLFGRYVLPMLPSDLFPEKIRMNKFFSYVNKSLSKIGNNTLGIYVMHYYFVLLIPVACDHLFMKDTYHQYYITFCICVSLMITLVCLLLCSIIKRNKTACKLLLGT